MKKRILIIIIQTMSVILSASSKLPAFGINPIQVVNEFVKSAKTADFGKLADLSCKDFELYLTLEDAKKLNLGEIGYIEEIVREERCEVDPEGLYIVISRINCRGEMNFGCFFVFKTTRGWKVYISEKYLWKYPIDELSISEIALTFYYTNKINLDVALNLAKRIVKSNPNTAESHIKLGQVYYIKGLQEDAIAEYAKAIKIKINELYNTPRKSIIGLLLGANLENYAEENIEPKEALIGTWKCAGSP